MANETLFVLILLMFIGASPGSCGGGIKTTTLACLAISLAERLHNPNMIEYLPFVEGYSIIESAPPKGFIGKSLHELDLINRYGVQVVAIKEIILDQLNLIPTAQFVVKDSDILILLGPNKAFDKLFGKEP